MVWIGGGRERGGNEGNERGGRRGREGEGEEDEGGKMVGGKRMMFVW